MLSKIEKNRVIAELRNFGCNETETGIYLQCLQLGPSTIQEVAHTLNMNRVTVYSAVENLMKKGILFETRQKKKRLVAAESPDIFYKLLQTQQNELKVVENNLHYSVELLNSLVMTSRSIPTVKLYEDVDGFKRMLEDTLTAKGELLVFSYVDLFSKLVGVDYLVDYFVRRAARNIHTRLLFPPCDFATLVNKKAKEYKIEVRILPPELRWKAGTFMWNNNISLLSFTESKLTCTIIENEDIAYFLRNVVFEMCWGKGNPIG